jgi:hypothetical protein
VPGPNVGREERLRIARRRIANILRAHIVAPMRTLEQKISDAGPSPQRVDPHLLTEALKELVSRGSVAAFDRSRTRWYNDAGTPHVILDARLKELLPVHEAVSEHGFTTRLGQTLEVAIYKALVAGSQLPFFGAFRDLDEHDDSIRYRKEEPPAWISGRKIPNEGRFDFLVSHPAAGIAGIEAKNIRPWMYPHSEEVKELLRKSVYVDAVPVLVARRIHYSTFSVLNPCGVVIHQTYNQLFPSADAALAKLAADKKLLGYHDIRVGNEPDVRLQRFLRANLPELLVQARTAFIKYKDLLAEYALNQMPYTEFAARVKRRSRGDPEDLEPFGDEDED